MRTKILTIIALICVTVLSSCKKDDDNDSNVTGRWNVTEFNASGSWENVASGKMYAIFNSDATYKAKFNSSSYSGTWTQSDKIITCNVSGVYITYTILSMKRNSGTFEVKEPGYKPYSVKANRE